MGIDLRKESEGGGGTPVIPTFNVDRVLVLQAWLNSTTQDTNSTIRNYTYNTNNQNASYITVSGQRTTFNQKGEYDINACIRVSNAQAANRSKFLMRIIHYNSANQPLSFYEGSDCYIRGDISLYDKGQATATAHIIANAGDYILVQTQRLYSEDTGGNNYAASNQSRLTINYFNYTLS